jgi:single-strand DNA-binding protein
MNKPHAFPSNRALNHAVRARSGSDPTNTRPIEDLTHPQFQVINLIGRLTANPELRSTESGNVARLRIAVQRRPRNGQDRGADYIDVTAFGALGDNCAQYLTKGRRVGITGRLHHSEWVAEDGRRQRLEVIADNVEFLEVPRSDPAEATPVQTAA